MRMISWRGRTRVYILHLRRLPRGLKIARRGREESHEQEHGRPANDKATAGQEYRLYSLLEQCLQIM